MSFPVVVIIHLFSIPAWFVVERKRAFVPVLMLLGAGLFLSRTYAFNKFTGEDEEKTEARSKFSVMNYNTHYFQRDREAWREEVKKEIAKMKAWIVGKDADVLCMPEFLNDDDSKGVLDTRNYFRSKGYKYKAMFPPKKSKRKGYWGLAIFSKHPIIASRDTVFEEQNGMIQTDIKIGKDTVRVIAVHLYSMTLRLGTLIDQKEIDGLKREGRVTFGKMKNGFQERAGECDAIQSWAQQSPYPVIVCGDFNEIPYGYVYGKLRKTLRNSFEEKGEGFGFTYNQLPYFIRIDHQFYDDKRLLLLDFKTFSDVKYSDHYPIMGHYTIKQ